MTLSENIALRFEWCTRENWT